VVLLAWIVWHGAYPQCKSINRKHEIEVSKKAAWHVEVVASPMRSAPTSVGSKVLNTL